MSANTITASSNDNLESTTRELWLETVVDQVLLKSAVIGKLLDRGRDVWKAGKVITKTIDTAETDETSQFYTVGEGMTATRKTTLDRAYFDRKYLQTPVVMDVNESLDNDGGVESVIDLAEYLVKKAQRATRIKLIKAIYSSSTTDATGSFQGIYQALNHDATYGHLSRATTVTNGYWQGASLDDTYADQDDAQTISVSLIRQCTAKLSEHMDDVADLFYVMGPSLWLTLQAQLDGSVNYQPGPMQLKYGFTSFMIDGVECIKDDYLTDTNLSAESDPDKWLFGLNAAEWEFRLHPKRALTLKPFVWQGDRQDAVDQELSRVMAAGNLVTWKPRASIMLTNVT